MKNYYEFSKPNPTLKEFHRAYMYSAEDVGTERDEMDAHDLPTEVSIRVEDAQGYTEDLELEIIGLANDLLMGCGCNQGIVIVARRK